jgi:hypothetical protein
MVASFFWAAAGLLFVSGFWQAWKLVQLVGLGFGLWFSRSKAFSLLVEVAFDGGCWGGAEVLVYSLCCEFRPSCEVAGIYGFSECGDCRGSGAGV